MDAPSTSDFIERSLIHWLGEYAHTPTADAPALPASIPPDGTLLASLVPIVPLAAENRHALTFTVMHKE
jgi:hypothetical protein